jgi:hypothetical protein
MTAARTFSHHLEDARQARHNRRALQILLATGAVMLALGLSWGLFFFLRGAWWVAGAELMLAGLAVAVILSARRQQVRVSAWMAFTGLFVFVCWRLPPTMSSAPNPRGGGMAASRCSCWPSSCLPRCRKACRRATPLAPTSAMSASG